MKSTCPPLQVILVGLEPNQQGHAASHEQASSSWPVIFHGVLSLGSFAARRGTPRQRRPTTSMQGKRDVVFMARYFTATALPDKPILWCPPAVAVAVPATRCVADYTSERRFAQRSGYTESAFAQLRRGRRRSGYKKNQRVTRLELATSSLARRCSTTELHPRFEREEIMSSGRRDATFLIAPQSGIFE